MKGIGRLQKQAMLDVALRHLKVRGEIDFFPMFPVDEIQHRLLL